jgi:hypothetical protein
MFFAACLTTEYSEIEQMKKILIALGCLATALSTFSQNPLIQTMLNEVEIDSLLFNANAISGETGVVVQGVTDTIKSRHKTKPGNELAFRYLRQRFEDYGLQTDSLIFSATGKNILAIQPGMVYPNQYLIFCAHYDCMPNVNVAPAADDDGSGVATVLEAARILSQYQFEYTIVYAIWDEEEQGLAGSAAYATLADNQNDSLIGVLNMDAIAWDSDSNNVAMIHTGSTANSLQLAMMIDDVNNDYSIGLDLNLINPGATYSDHASFWNHGFGAVLIIEDWQFDANPHYHTVTDKVQYFNTPYFHRMAKLSIGSTATLAVPYTLSTNEKEAFENLVIFPNPGGSWFFVALNETTNDPVQIKVHSSDGKLMFTQNYSAQNNMRISSESWEKGLYFISIENTIGTRVVKWIKY